MKVKARSGFLSQPNTLSVYAMKRQSEEQSCIHAYMHAHTNILWGQHFVPRLQFLARPVVTTQKLAHALEPIFRTSFVAFFFHLQIISADAQIDLFILIRKVKAEFEHWGASVGSECSSYSGSARVTHKETKCTLGFSESIAKEAASSEQ